MTAEPAAALAEARVPDDRAPRMELEAWRRDYGVVAGITIPGEGSPGFNLALGGDESVRTVLGRWRTFREAETGFSALVMSGQVHGRVVRWHEDLEGWVIQNAADGHATGVPGVLLAVTVADCIPVYLIAPRQRVVVLLHAGWRGTAAGVLRAGVEVLSQRREVPPGEILMHCGIGICGKCYEVGSEVPRALGIPAPEPGPWHLDLREVLARQARALGLREVSISPWCTAHDFPRFYSHRASRGASGRMVAYLGLLPD